MNHLPIRFSPSAPGERAATVRKHSANQPVGVEDEKEPQAGGGVFELKVLIDIEALRELLLGGGTLTAGHAAPECPTLSPREVADMLGVSEFTVRRRIEAGTIPAIPGIGRVRVSRQALEAMLSNPKPQTGNGSR